MPADTRTTLTWHLKDEVSGPARGIGGALGGLVSPTTLAVAGIGALVAGLGAAAGAAAEEQINIKKLDTALRASVPGWTGNTNAIEELISQRENLAFSDDELRSSLAALVTSTHDVEEAERLQAIAMDLARLKGVDLETATLAVTKASQGSTRELKALGLEIDDNATAAENLASIQQAAAGQAEAYGSTSAAAWETLKIKFDDVVETVGSALIGPLGELATWVTQEIIPDLEGFAEAVGPGLRTAMRIAGDGVTQLMKLLSPLLDLINRVTSAAGGLAGVLGIVGGIVSPGGTIAAQLQARMAPRAGTVAKRITRAAGGPVDAGGAYLVGEQGPEWLMMGNRSGTIIPGGGSGGLTPVEIPVILNDEEIGRVVDRRLYIAMATAGGSAQPR